MALNFSYLYDKDFRIEYIFVMHQTFWKEKSEYRTKVPRPTDGLLYFESAAAQCFLQDGTSFSVPKGSWVYLARGSQYRWKITGDHCSEPITWLFNFTLSDAEGRPFDLGKGIQVIHPENPEYCRLHFKGLLREAMRPRAFPAALRGQAYSLLSELIKTHYFQNLVLTEGIHEGIRYLENDIAQEKSIEEIADMCHMSLSSFEKQFKNYSGLSPREYRLERRLERAELLLQNSDIPIRRIAEDLGFYDAAAFAKIFKKKRGLSPSALRK